MRAHFRKLRAELRIASRVRVVNTRAGRKCDVSPLPPGSSAFSAPECGSLNSPARAGDQPVIVAKPYEAERKVRSEREREREKDEKMRFTRDSHERRAPVRSKPGLNFHLGLSARIRDTSMSSRAIFHGCSVPLASAFCESGMP